MIGENLRQFWQYTGFANFEWTYLLMICIGLVFIYLAIKKEWEPMLLVPIGFGIIIGNIPLFPGLSVGIYEEGSVQGLLPASDLPRNRCDDRLLRPDLQP